MAKYSELSNIIADDGEYHIYGVIIDLNCQTNQIFAYKESLSDYIVLSQQKSIKAHAERMKEVLCHVEIYYNCLSLLFDGNTPSKCSFI